MQPLKIKGSTKVRNLCESSYKECYLKYGSLMRDLLQVSCNLFPILAIIFGTPPFCSRHVTQRFKEKHNLWSLLTRRSLPSSAKDMLSAADSSHPGIEFKDLLWSYSGFVILPHLLFVEGLCQKWEPAVQSRSTPAGSAFHSHREGV